MRTQRNPNYKKPLTQAIKPVVFLVVTHLPDNDNSGYYANRFDVIKTCLTTMREQARQEHDFMVWDNNSGKILLNWLQDEFKPDILVQSPNFGKGLARALAVHMLPENTIVCYSDDDIYFENNWFQPQLVLLRLYPNVSIVSGYPVRTQFRHGCENTISWAQENAKLETGRFILDEWEKQHASSVGWGWEKYKNLTKDDIDYRVTYHGVQAYTTAHHCQFIGIVKNILPVVDVANDGLITPNEWTLDVALDKIGLRLCTINRLCIHIGNVLDDSFDV